MNLRKIKPSNTQNIVPLELIKQKNYNKIINLINQNPINQDSDIYIYSYALLRTLRPLEALINLYSLVKKYPNLEEDCNCIGRLLFKEEDFLSKVPMDEKVLYILLQVARNTILDHKIYVELQKKLFNLLWERQEYAKLENILKSYKKEKDGILLENLSKVNFMQYEHKLSNNILGFIGYTLTGAGCLILRDQFYQNNLEKQINAVVFELKKLFLEVSIKFKSKFLDLKFLNAFLEYEAQVLIEVLKIAIKYGIDLDLVATPSYFINYDPANLLLAKFKLWLQKYDLNLDLLYNQITYDAIIGVLSGDQKLLKSVAKHKLDPALLLAIKLRNTSLKKSVVVSNDLGNLNNSSDLMKNILFNTIKIMLDNKVDPQFLEIIMSSDLIIEDLEISSILRNKLIQDLKARSAIEENLDLKSAQNFAKKLNNATFIQQIDILSKRQEACVDFLFKIKNLKKSNELINQIKSREELVQHFTLIADLKVLVAKDLSKSLSECFRHVKRLVQNKKINKIEDLSEDLNLDCDCENCQKHFLYVGLPYIINLLNIEVTTIPNEITYTKPYEKETSSKKSILSLDDPFVTLGVNLSDPKLFIMQKTLELIKQFPERVISLRSAQNELFDPEKRFLHHYFRYLSFKEGNDFALSDFNIDLIPFREEIFYNAK